MLILSRRLGEAVNINGEIEVKVIDLCGDKVKIGIQAPNNVKILRSELCLTMESNKDAAASVNSRRLLGMLTDMEND